MSDERRRHFQLDDLIAMSRLWWALDVPIYVDLGGHEIPLRYRYITSSGLHLELEPPEAK